MNGAECFSLFLCPAVTFVVPGFTGETGPGDLCDAMEGERVARGGSWLDRSSRASASFRLPYRYDRKVFNVVFRVVCPAKSGGAATQSAGGGRALVTGR